MHLTGLVRPAALTALLAVAAPSLTFAQSTQTGAAAVETARQAISEWVDLQTRIATAKSAWAQEKEIAAYRISLYERELERLAETIAEGLSAATTAEQRRGELEAQAAAIRAATAPLESRIAGYEARLRELQPQLPAPLASHLSQFYSRLPEPNQAQMPDLSHRLATVVGLFTEIEKFNRAITIHPDTRQLPDGTRLQVKSLYIGLAAAYAASEDGTKGWIGHPGPDGWNWESKDDAAAAIARTIGIYERTVTPATYVPLPARID